MRWFPTLLFSHSHSSSTTSTSTPSPSSSSASATLNPSASTSSLPDSTKNMRTGWFFGTGKMSTRSRKLRHMSDLDTVAVAPLSRSSSTFDRSSTSYVEPQPLPLPRDADYRLPSPIDAATAAVDVTLTPGFRMRR